MDAKHQFKYTYNDTSLEEYSPVDITFDVPGEVTIPQMLWNFECYLKACGFVFDGHLEVVPEESYSLEDLGWEDEPLVDSDYDGTKLSSCCDVKDDTLYNESSQCLAKNAHEYISELPSLTTKFNKDLSKLEAEVKKNKYKDWDKNNPDNCWNS
jgi:hypothetical protein